MRIFRQISLLVIIFILPFNLAAEDDIQVLVDEIQALADKSRQERAADRWLQIALEDLVAKYNFPWKNSLLSDDFADGDYTSGVQWQIDSGEFWVDRRLGLRSQVVETIDNSRQQPAQQQQDKPDEDTFSRFSKEIKARILAASQNVTFDKKQMLSFEIKELRRLTDSKVLPEQAYHRAKNRVMKMHI